jgi:hypothetical protein
MDMDISSSMSLSSQEAAQYLMQPSEEEEDYEWIYCNACQKWFHSL